MDTDFFKKQTRSSEVKAKIVAEYFPQYCRIILKAPLEHKQIRYIDLFAGPGIYEDNKLSTPLLLARACANDPALKNIVRLIFNDKEHSEKLKENFKKFFPEKTFKHDPVFKNKTVGEDLSIDNFLNKEPEKTNPFPTLLFFDPFGYKGINTLILSKFLSNWGNELFLFVNIKRINQAISVGKFDEMMQSLFPTTIEELRMDRKYKSTSVHERLILIMNHLALEFDKAVTGPKLYSCEFRFQEEDSIATSHFIIHFTKHPRGFELVKQIYYDFDNIGATLERDGTYTFDAKKMGSSSIDFGDQNVQLLSTHILNKYKGRRISAKALFDEHQSTSKWAGSHYSKTLRYMVERSQVKTTFTDNKKHKVSVLLSKECILDFN
ncbi:three-Cys-motif partner protein TcmP [Mucilaginibacter sp. OK098]|uniref:three-Cys-motif partner protein TcmP n=1 Tax=Mucilaginibacter sp. OK098 TaxID=1855297 RepID=UPI00091B0BD8|nr:three-Cys-motif partner protein TcmP [Mucilaginibacter sp. OK098]SHN33272.1 three-Cys-motif partner protein [Mucilaginibacter sp. OK098]